MSLYQSLGGAAQGPLGNIAGITQQFQQFQANFKGDPEQEISKMLQSGRINQQQLNQAQAMARQLGGMMGLFKQ